MVSFIPRLSTIDSSLLAASQSAEKLPPTTRAMVMMALLGILLVGLFFVVAILLGGHWVRRLGKHQRGPVVPPDVPPLQLKVQSKTSREAISKESHHGHKLNLANNTDETRSFDNTVDNTVEN